jgi:hypothetical protein
LRTKLNATWVGSLAHKILKEDRIVAGTVTNTFPNSFYTRMFNDQLLFVTNRPLRSPVTINVDSRSNFEQLVKPQERVSVHRGEINLGDDVSIDLSEAEDYSPQINLTQRNMQSEPIKEALHSFALILRIIDTTNSILDERGLTHEAATEFVQKGIIPLRSSPVNALGEAQNLVGLGSGFTPSGDDMLGGFLAMYNSFAKNLRRPPVLLNPELLERKTNWISAKLLDYMQKLILDEQISRIVGAPDSGNMDQIVLALESIFPRGHTSGIDIAVGTVLGLGIVHDIASDTKETEIIAGKMGLTQSPTLV